MLLILDGSLNDVSCYPIAINVAYVLQRHGISPVTLLCESRDSTVSNEPFVSVSCHCRILRSVIIPISMLVYSSLMFYCFPLVDLSSLISLPFTFNLFLCLWHFKLRNPELKLKCLHFNNLLLFHCMVSSAQVISVIPSYILMTKYLSLHL